MPRPPDTYTHSQFEPVESDAKGDTGRCVHCRHWTGNLRNLARKKDHLARCSPYIAWRAQGNGQDIPPANAYNKRTSQTAFGAADDNVSNYEYPDYHTDAAMQGQSYQYPTTPTQPPVQRQSHTELTSKVSSDASLQQINILNEAPSSEPTNRALTLTQNFNEFWDDANNQKCMRVRCKHCGFQRAKNSTRQVEHLQSCKEFLNTTEGQAALANGELNNGHQAIRPGPTDVYRGNKPNPGLSVQRRAPGRPRGGGNAGAAMRPPPIPTKPIPSLANHLLLREAAVFKVATEQPFLSHAGCGTLGSTPLSQWLAQDGYISRAFISFIGTLIGKIRLPETQQSHASTPYRALDLLISALNNIRREMTFFETTQQKYGLPPSAGDAPRPATRGFTDLLASVSSPSASLLEGMVVLWATEHCYRTSWTHAASFTSTVPRSNYTVPSYLQQGQGGPISGGPYGLGANANPDSAHIAALHQALIPNWTSSAFAKFVDACRSIVDELANGQTSGNGKEEMVRCESVFKQVVWLWERIWPEVDGMGQEDELTPEHARHSSVSHTPGGGGRTASSGARVRGGGASASGSGGANGNRRTSNQQPIEIQDDGDDDNDGQDDSNLDAPAADSPYGGTGLGAIAAANRID